MTMAGPVQVSGMKYGAYLRQHILEPAGLASTLYDTAYGYNGALLNYLPAFGYRQIVAPVSQGRWSGSDLGRERRA